MTFSRKPLIGKVHLGPKLVGDPDADIAKRLSDAMAYINDSSKGFARSLIENQSMYGWSDKQRNWAGILLEQARDAYRAARNAARALEGEASAAQLNELLDGRRPAAAAAAQPAAVSNAAMAMLLKLFVNAAQAKGKRAPMLLTRVDGRIARIKIGKEGGYVLFWADAAQGEGYVCSVAVTGVVRAREARLASLVAAALNRFADPAAAARMFGAETSSCMCCARELDHPVSVKYGIGPICNSRWGVYPSGEYVLAKGDKVAG